MENYIRCIIKLIFCRIENKRLLGGEGMNMEMVKVKQECGAQ